MSFHEYLRDELQRRQSRNRRYSLRAFARSLRTDHSTLSQILRRQRALTATAIRRIGKECGLDEAQIETFATEATIARLTSHRAFRFDSRKLARRLGISVDEVNVILQRLLRVHAMTMTWRKRNE